MMRGIGTSNQERLRAQFQVCGRLLPGARYQSDRRHLARFLVHSFPLDICTAGPMTRILLICLWPRLLRRKVNEQDVGIFSQPVEYNPATIGSDIKGPHGGGIVQPGQTP